MSEILKPIQIHFENQGLDFQPSSTAFFEGRILWTSEQQQMVIQRLRAEPDDWWADENGNRLPATELFKRSLWSYHQESKSQPLLCRYINYETGEAMFSVPETYLEHGLTG